MMNLVRCDECGRNFRIRPQTEELPGGGERRFFACPHCGAEYTTLELTARGRELHARLVRLNKTLRTAISARPADPMLPLERLNHRRRIGRLQARIKEVQAALEHESGAQAVKCP